MTPTLRITTRHERLADFLTSFSRWVNADGSEESLFIITNEPRPLGMRLSFHVRLRDGEPVLRGSAEVDGVYMGHDGPGGKNGIKLRLLDLEPESRDVFAQLVERRIGSRSDTTMPPRVDFAALIKLPDDVIETMLETLLPAPPEPEPEPAAAPAEVRPAGESPLPSRAGREARPPIAVPRVPTTTLVVAIVLLAGAAALIVGLIYATRATAEVEAPPSAPVVSLADKPPDAAPRCRARLTTEPPGAVVLYHGERLGETPLVDVEVPCGDAEVSFRLKGYATVELMAAAKTDAPAELHERLVTGTTRLSIKSTPPGAVFSLNGISLGAAPIERDVPRGRPILIRAELPGFVATEQQLMPRGATQVVNVRLEPGGSE